MCSYEPCNPACGSQAAPVRRPLQRAAPAAARPLGLSGLPLPGSLVHFPSAYATLALGVGVPFAMDAVPWGRIPRWAETVALLGSVSPLLLSRPDSHEAELIALPVLNIVVLFIALYGNRLELVAGVALVALHFGLPQPGEPFTPAELIRDAVLTSLTALVAACGLPALPRSRGHRPPSLAGAAQ